MGVWTASCEAYPDGNRCQCLRPGTCARVECGPKVLGAGRVAPNAQRPRHYLRALPLNQALVGTALDSQGWRWWRNTRKKQHTAHTDAAVHPARMSDG